MRVKFNILILLSALSTVVSGNYAQVGSTCSNPNVLLSLPFSQTGMTTCGFVSDYSPADACATIYMAGEDYVFSYTPSISAGIDISLTGTSPLASIFILDGCPNAVGTVCVASAEGANPSLTCIPITGGTTYYFVVSSAPFLPPFPLPPILCGSFDISIQESPGGGAPPSCNMDYSITSIPNATVSYASGTSLIFSDDYFSPVWVNFGFSFCFDGVLYDQCLISSNGYITFPGCFGSIPGGDPNPGGYSPYSISAAAPNATNAPGNSIMLTWQDINPNVGGTIMYESTGTSPNQIFIVKYDDVPMFGCGSSPAINFSGQLMLYETSNLIEFHITQKTACAGWNGGAGIMGLNNYNGTIAVIAPGPPNHNYPTAWAESNTGYRITPNCTGAICSIALPIKLLDFSGEAVDDGNRVTWVTESETNNDYFILERSTNGEDFSEITRVDGSGTTNQTNYYEFMDRNLTSNQSFYRLKQVDSEGDETISSIIVVHRSATFDVNFYPNPTENNVKAVIEFSEIALCKVQIAGVLGIVEEYDVQLSKGTNTITLDAFEQLAQGIYYVNIMNYNGETIAMEKIVKQ